MNGSQFLAALLVGLVPSLLWLFFWLREDSMHSEPRALLAGCFLSGMLIPLIAIPIEQWLVQFSDTATMKYALWSAAEETLKILAVAIVALNTRWNDEPVDAMIYCISVALGFAAMENTLFVMDPISRGDLAASIIHGNLRSIGATLVHVVSSALVGFAIGANFYNTKLAKALAFVFALIIAIVVHAAFNISITTGGATDALKTFGWVWAAAVILIVLFEEVKSIRPKTITGVI